jgi:hypothetical protein
MRATTMDDEKSRTLEEKKHAYTDILRKLQKTETLINHAI